MDSLAEAAVGTTTTVVVGSSLSSSFFAAVEMVEASSKKVNFCQHKFSLPTKKAALPQLFLLLVDCHRQTIGLLSFLFLLL
jgi:hypothetical protein